MMTQRYNYKQRLGKGFSLDELYNVGISPKFARTIGIKVDHRRINKSKQGFQENTKRLEEYLKKIEIIKKKQKKSIKNFKQEFKYVSLEKNKITQPKGEILYSKKKQPVKIKKVKISH